MSDDGASRALKTLLVESARGDGGTLPAALADVPVGFALDAAAHHRVAPAVARRLAIAGDDAPEGWRDAFGERRTEQVFRQLRTAADLRALTAVLDGAAIPFVVAKGPVVAELWPHAAMREYHDLDVFVSSGTFGQALDSLHAGGFAIVDRNWVEIHRTGRAEVALVGPVGTPIDLHWHIAVPRALRTQFSIDMAAMLDRSRPMDVVGSGRVAVFDPVDTVLHLAFHSAQAGAARLMWAADVHHAVCAPGFDFDELEYRSERAGVALATALILQRTRSTFGTPFDMPPLSARRLRGAWAAVERRGRTERVFPALPGEKGSGEMVFASARDSIAGTIPAAIRHAVAVRRVERHVERHGPEGRVLHRDVPGDGARDSYLLAVARGAE